MLWVKAEYLLFYEIFTYLWGGYGALMWHVMGNSDPLSKRVPRSKSFKPLLFVLNKISWEFTLVGIYQNWQCYVCDGVCYVCDGAWNCMSEVKKSIVFFKYLVFQKSDKEHSYRTTKSVDMHIAIYFGIL